MEAPTPEPDTADAAAVIQAHGKVNLALRVGARRSDGYHDLTTVFMAVSLADEIACRSLPDGRIEVTTRGDGTGLVPSDDTNLAARAARLLRSTAGNPELGVHIDIGKAIPVAGGMAGGSADAAGALRGCNRLWQLDLPNDDLAVLATQLGADVPFALLGGVALGIGRGDALTALPVQGTYHWVFALAHEGLSTPAVFAQFDQLAPARQARPDMAALTAHLAAGHQVGVGAALENDLTAAAVALRPQLGETLAFGAAQTGVLGGVLAGSGPTCAFLCASPQIARQLAAKLSDLPQVAGTRLATGPAPGAQLEE